MEFVRYVLSSIVYVDFRQDKTGRLTNGNTISRVSQYIMTDSAEQLTVYLRDGPVLCILALTRIFRSIQSPESGDSEV